MPKRKIVVVDERQGQLTDTNVSAEDRDAINKADILVTIFQDIVHVNDASVRVIAPKSESQLSLEKAQRERFHREEKKTDDESYSPLEKMSAVWEGSSLEEARVFQSTPPEDLSSDKTNPAVEE